MSKYCQVWLTCENQDEATGIAKVLLEKKLIACAKYIPLTANFLWEGSIDTNDEILVVMETREDMFEKIESEVEIVHSYETFVLQAIPMTKTSKKAAKWLEDSLSP